jgi:hypothetical protein
LQGVTIKDVVYRYEEVIRGLDTSPIIIGHSFGGLFVQPLLNRGLGCGVPAWASLLVINLLLLTVRMNAT